ncbi:hypothetical protein M885DRAFT_261161 [Pelagophyceae sp. CCMP2097]|nr:hypothetical protein M885DRAFT_261161 [Pelagophyceae sp. CCMP2097]
MIPPLKIPPLKYGPVGSHAAAGGCLRCSLRLSCDAPAGHSRNFRTRLNCRTIAAQLQVWAYAKAGIEAPVLFQAFAFVAVKKLPEFDSQNLANVVWAFAKSGFLRRVRDLARQPGKCLQPGKCKPAQAAPRADGARTDFKDRDAGSRRRPVASGAEALGLAAAPEENQRVASGLGPSRSNCSRPSPPRRRRSSGSSTRRTWRTSPGPLRRRASRRQSSSKAWLMKRRRRFRRSPRRLWPTLPGPLQRSG